MAITDELREYTEEQIKWVDMTKVHYRNLFAIADRIDAEHAEAQRRWMAELDAARNGEGSVELPKDADGEHIRIGDKMEWTDGNGPHAREVTYLQLTSSGWYVGVKGCGLFGALELLRHHKQPTVEDVLTEFGIDWEHESDCEDRAALLAEYAKRLKLAGEGNE